MYAIHFRRSADSKGDYALIDEIKTLDEAREKRVVAGDLVVYQRTGEVVTDETWLWEWELADPNCFARRAMKHASMEK